MFIRTPVTRDQRQRIEVAIAYPDKFRDDRILVTEDNLVTYGWISTRIELDSDQLRRYKLAPAPKKSKPTSREPSFVAEEGVPLLRRRALPPGR